MGAGKKKPISHGRLTRTEIRYIFWKSTVLLIMCSLTGDFLISMARRNLEAFQRGGDLLDYVQQNWQQRNQLFNPSPTMLVFY